MGEHTFSYQLRGSASTYWRRRFIVLVVGLTVFAVAAWGLSEALRVSPASGAGARHGQPGHRGSAGGGTSGRGNRGHQTGGNARHQGAGHAGRHGRRHPATGTSDQPRSAPSPATSASASRFGGYSPAFCSWHAIVLSLSATQLAFGARQVPGFSLSVVSTQRSACSFNVGSAHLALVIKEGTTRIWSSADCAGGAGGLVAALRRGVPTVVAINWHRRTSAPGCTSPARSVPPGVYTGYAVDGSLASAPVTFRLS